MRLGHPEKFYALLIDGYADHLSSRTGGSASIWDEGWTHTHRGNGAREKQYVYRIRK